MMGAALLALGLVLAPLPDTLPAVLRGQVRSEGTQAVLGGATVQLRGGGKARAGTTDAAGRYRFSGVAPGSYALRAWRAGFEPMELEVQLPPGGDVELEVALRPRVIALEGIRVRSAPEGDGGDSVTAPPPAVRPEVRALESTPGFAELGLGDRPPGQAPLDPAEVLYVRGAPADRKLVLLDGAPVYTPFHLAGLLPAFDEHALGAATLYLGGAPARYDGGLSYILELRTRPGRFGRPGMSGAVDGLGARLLADGAIGNRVRLRAGGRAIHGLGLAPLFQGSFPYAYTEGLARVDVDAGRGSSVSATLFANREGVRLDTGAIDRARWGNSALALRYRGWLAGSRAELAAAVSGYDAGLPQTGTPVRGATRRGRVTADLSRTAGPLEVGFGGSWDRLVIHSPLLLPREVGGLRLPAADLLGDAAGAYLEAGWQVAPRLRLRGGMRADWFSAEPALRFVPRVSATWLIGERAALVAAGGRYYQYVRLLESAPASREVVPDSVFFPAGLAVGNASHFSLALQQELDAGVRLGVEGFYKRFGGTQPVGGAYASGGDLWLRRDAGRIRGWLGYNLTWVWSLPDSARSTERFAGRQLLSAGAAGDLGRWGELELRVAYGAGLPFTGIPVEPSSPSVGDSRTQSFNTTDAAEDRPPLTTVAAEPYLRVDVGLSRTWNTRWGGRPVQISPYLRVLNALDRRDGLFYRSDAGEQARAVGSLPLLPVFGVAWAF